MKTYISVKCKTSIFCFSHRHGHHSNVMHFKRKRRSTISRWSTLGNILGKITVFISLLRSCSASAACERAENFEHLGYLDRRKWVKWPFRNPNSTFLVGFLGIQMKDCWLMYGFSLKSRILGVVTRPPCPRRFLRHCSGYQSNVCQAISKIFSPRSSRAVNVKPWLTMMLVIKDEDLLYVTYPMLITQILRNINSEFWRFAVGRFIWKAWWIHD